MIIAILALLYLLLLVFPGLADFLLVFLKLLPLLAVAAVFIGMGTLTWVINNAKGRDGGFWWGFFLTFIGVLVVAVRRPVRVVTPVQGESLPLYLENPGAWYCPKCGRSHAVYEHSCVCGAMKTDVRDNFDFEAFQPEVRAMGLQ